MHRRDKRQNRRREPQVLGTVPYMEQVQYDGVGRKQVGRDVECMTKPDQNWE